MKRGGHQLSQSNVYAGAGTSLQVESENPMDVSPNANDEQHQIVDNDAEDDKNTNMDKNSQVDKVPSDHEDFDFTTP